MEEKTELYVEGMHCAACELFVEKKLRKSGLVEEVDANLNTQKVKFKINSKLPLEEIISELNEQIKSGGYKILAQQNKLNINYKQLGKALFIAVIIMGGFFGLQKIGVADILSPSGELTLPTVFLIGIIASLSSCMAVVGGLVLSISASFSKEKKAKPLIFFHVARILTFFILGGLIGLIGAAFQLSQSFYFVISTVLFFVMIVLGLNLLDIFPFFRKFQLRIPKQLTSKSLDKEITNVFTPIIFGIITFFLPCGFTQSMQFNAIASADFVKGSLIMGIFALGTLPVLSLVSFASNKFSTGMNSKLFFQVAGFVVLFFAILNFWSSLASVGLLQSPF